jgi:hypothetical protein
MEDRTRGNNYWSTKNNVKHNQLQPQQNQKISPEQEIQAKGTDKAV